jgi:hypothetical protein
MVELVAFGLQLLLTALGDAGLRLKRMCAPRGLGRQHNQSADSVQHSGKCGKDECFMSSVYARLYPCTHLTSGRTAAARSRYGVGGRRGP